MGDKMTRSSLTSAAQHHVKHGNTALAAWGLALSEKLWKGGVHTAVARKLAVTMLAMWKPGKSYEFASAGGSIPHTGHGSTPAWERQDGKP